MLLYYYCMCVRICAVLCVCVVVVVSPLLLEGECRGVGGDIFVFFKWFGKGL